MLMGIKCIALDMDRTTLNAEGKLSDTNRKALQDAMDMGVHIVIASGRSFSALPEDVMALKGIEYAITCNGAEVYYIPEKKRMKSYCLSKQAVTAIVEITKNMPVTYEAFIRGQAYAGIEYVNDPVRFGATPQAVDYVKRTRTMIRDIRAFIAEHNKELNSMDIIVKSPEMKDFVWKLLEEKVEDIYITSSITQLIEISDKNAGKHSGLKFVAQHLGISREEIAAFGDADNDVDMLREAGIGISVANGSKKCIEAADMVVGCHDADGVAEGIYKILK